MARGLRQSKSPKRSHALGDRRIWTSTKWVVNLETISAGQNLKVARRHRHCSGSYDRDPREDEFSDECNAAMDELINYLGTPIDVDPLGFENSPYLVRIQRALEICVKHGLHPAGFAVRCGFECWRRDTEARHMAECADPECDWACCRLARGWTEEEIKADIEAGRRQRDEAKRQRITAVESA